jgi:hydroxymethylpyrimidine pyrophosphatase-like HAD family hydrolase
VTGGELDELCQVFPRIEIFDIVVAENGALLYWPASGKQKPLADPPPNSLIAAMEARGVDPIAVGSAIVATWAVHQAAVQAAIGEAGLDWQPILNKRSLMVLPRGIDKASGLTAALELLGIAPEETVAVGDAENDRTFLNLCGYSAAVANALPVIRGSVDMVTAGDHGRGVVELIDRILADELGE